MKNNISYAYSVALNYLKPFMVSIVLFSVAPAGNCAAQLSSLDLTEASFIERTAALKNQPMEDRLEREGKIARLIEELRVIDRSAKPGSCPITRDVSYEFSQVYLDALNLRKGSTREYLGKGPSRGMLAEPQFRIDKNPMPRGFFVQQELYSGTRTVAHEDMPMLEEALQIVEEHAQNLKKTIVMNKPAPAAASSSTESDLFAAYHSRG